MAYRLELSPQFREDFADTLRYIRDKLRNPIAANHLVSAFEEAAKSVSGYPCATKPLMIGSSEEAYYFVRVKNYLAFYVVDETTVQFRRFLYAHSDIIARLL